MVGEVTEYIVLFTHNPQDYFNGYECPELVEVRAFQKEDFLREITQMVSDGYHAIIFPKQVGGV